MDGVEGRDDFEVEPEDAGRHPVAQPDGCSAIRSGPTSFRIPSAAASPAPPTAPWCTPSSKRAAVGGSA